MIKKRIVVIMLVLSVMFAVTALVGCDKKEIAEEEAALGIESLFDIDKNDAIIKLVDLVSEKCQNGENLDALSGAEKSFYFNQCVEIEVNNGGFDQFFFNTSGNYAHETVQGLKDIGAEHTANIVQEAINIFPDATVPKDRVARWDVMEKISEQNEYAWSKLDTQFYEYVDDLNSLNLEFVRKNIGDFQLD